MIGLGSNRLTVCRRGGMSVTQAGRGGMEWLAGGRVPSWASPYSAQATAALKAQFPTQWPTIRDYGWEHPEIVGYMNAYAPEDAKIAYSLVEGIGYRGMLATNGAYINTGYIPAYNDEVHLKAKGTAYSNWFMGTRANVGGVNNLSFAFVMMDATTSRPYLYCAGSMNTNYVTVQSIAATEIIDYKTNGSKFTLNGREYNLPARVNANIGYPLTICALNNAGDVIGQSACSFCKLEIVGKKYFAPIKRNGVMECIDLVSGNLATRVGTFTELIETPSS